MWWGDGRAGIVRSGQVVQASVTTPSRSSALRIDLHTHILPHTWPDLEAKFGYGGFVRLDHHAPCEARMMVGDTCFREIDDACWNPDRRLRDCDQDHVDVQVLSTVPIMFCYWARPKDGLALAQILNDHLASVIVAHPTRFVGLGTVPMQDPSLAIRELTRCVRELGFAGVQIGSNVNGRNLDDPALFEIFAAAEELGAAVFVHPWEMVGQERMERYWLPWLVGMPAETSLAICSVLLGGIIDRLPALRIGFAHGGGAFPWLIGRLQKGFEARPDLVATASSVAPRSQLGKIYLDSLVHDTAGLTYLLRQVGEKRIALGSDYPFPLGESPVGHVIDAMPDLSPTTRSRLLAGTALEFLNRSAGMFASA